MVCRVNTEAIDRLMVEENMGAIPAKVRAARENMERLGNLTKENEAALEKAYNEPYCEALRQVIRFKLLLQAAKLEKLQIDEKMFQKRLQSHMDYIREKQTGESAIDIQARLRERMLVDSYRSRFSFFMDKPTRPEVKKYYTENIIKYQRKAGAKVRLIRIDRLVINPVTGQQVLRENALQLAETKRTDVVEYGGDFKAMAKEISDDESRSRSGLIQFDPQDPYINPESYNKEMAAALKDLKIGEVSKVFEMGKASWAFVLLEDRRESGPEPLEGPLYEKILNELSESKSNKKEDEWYRKELTKSLIVEYVNGKETKLPMRFFFPNEKEVVETPTPKTSDALNTTAPEPKK
jgi:parvulin-like peptidyl-prolyl isomerase